MDTSSDSAASGLAAAVATGSSLHVGSWALHLKGAAAGAHRPPLCIPRADIRAMPRVLGVIAC